MTMKKVLVTRRIPQPGIDLLAGRFDVDLNTEDRPLSREQLHARAMDCDGVLCLLTDRIDAAFFTACPKVRGVANYAVGYDNIDVAEATRSCVPVSNTPGVLTNATAEMAWALLFAVARRVVESDTVMRSGAWTGWGPLQFIGADVTGATLGIIGAGRIGTAMAMKSRGFDMTVLYCDDVRNETLETSVAACRVSLDTLLERSDFVSIHCPLLAHTRHLIGRRQLARMKHGACLINTARGPIVDEAALADALRGGAIAGAGLDVYEFEPRMADGLAELKNVVVTPHTASATVCSRIGMALAAARNLAAALDGKQPPDCVNPELFTAGVLSPAATITPDNGGNACR